MIAMVANEDIKCIILGAKVSDGITNTLAMIRSVKLEFPPSNC